MAHEVEPPPLPDQADQFVPGCAGLHESISQQTQVEDNITYPELFLSDGRLNPLYISWGFQTVIAQEFLEYEGKPGRRPKRFDGIYRVFEEHGFGSVRQETFFEVFNKVKDKDKKQNVSNAMTYLNQLFEKYDISLVIQGVTLSGRGQSATLYRICSWPSELEIAPCR